MLKLFGNELFSTAVWRRGAEHNISLHLIVFIFAFSYHVEANLLKYSR